ncbi:MAG: hypothetical protein LRY66_08470 [Saccharospirillaceae bacterium]|nr:hypothetical protein [Saccharospirillaceae bacterium]MCD8531383.1 hypothetical protein [Saccharospirillaceae bacterium]
MKYLFLLLAVFSADGFADFGQSCPFGHRNVQYGAYGGYECQRYKSVGSSNYPQRVYACKQDPGGSSGYEQLWFVAKSDCASTPADDSSESGCYADQLNNPAGTCSGEELKECVSSSGEIYRVESTKSCSDYCPGRGSGTGGNGSGSIHKFDGPYGDPNSHAENSCLAYLAQNPNGICRSTTDDPSTSRDESKHCYDYSPSGTNGSVEVIFTSCRTLGGDSPGTGGGDNPGTGGGDNPGTGGGDNPETGGGDNPGTGDSDNDGIPDNCSSQNFQCPTEQGYKIIVQDAATCSLLCQPPSTDPTDPTGPGTGNGDGGDSGGGDTGGDGGGTTDPSDPGTGGGGTGGDNPTGDPLGIDNFSSLKEKVAAKKGEYFDKLEEYQDRFSDLLKLNNNSSGSPFGSNKLNIFGVDIEFGTIRFQPFLDFLPALILFMASVYAAFILLGGMRK